MKSRTYYEILGVSRDASIEEITIAKNAQAKVYHPDANAHKNDSQDIIRHIIRLAFMNGGEVYSKSVSDMAENLDMQSLITLKHKLEKNVPTEIGCQLFEENEESVEAFSIKQK